MNKAVKIVYMMVILLLFIVAGVIGVFCIQYERIPEGIIILSCAVIVLVVSLVVAFSDPIVKDTVDDASALKTKDVPVSVENAKVLMTLRGTVQTYVNNKLNFGPVDAVVKMYDKYGIHILIDKKHKLLKYDDVDDIYKESDNDFVVGMKNGIEYKIVCSSLIKLMAFEDILNKQTDYRFDEDQSDEQDE